MRGAGARERVHDECIECWLGFFRRSLYIYSGKQLQRYSESSLVFLLGTAENTSSTIFDNRWNFEVRYRVLITRWRIRWVFMAFTLSVGLDEVNRIQRN